MRRPGGTSEAAAALARELDDAAMLLARVALTAYRHRAAVARRARPSEELLREAHRAAASAARGCQDGADASSWSGI